MDIQDGEKKSMGKILKVKFGKVCGGSSRQVRSTIVCMECSGWAGPH